MARCLLRPRVLGGTDAVVLSFLLLAGGITPARASLTYSNPFHPDQCEIAITASKRALSREPEDARAREILAEGLLCRGLERDDPWALAAALDALQARLSAHREDFFTRVYIAAALQRRYPLADETVIALERAQAALAGADVGAARAALGAYLDEAVAGAKAQRAQYLPLLQERAAAFERGRLAPTQLIELLTLLTQTGPAGIERAQEILHIHLMREPDIAFDTFYRAEILRGRESPQALRLLYRAAAAALCETPRSEHFNECQRARWRLEQLEAAGGDKQGG